MNRRFVFAMARREARSSARRLAFYGACMAVGIAALVGLQGLRASVQRALDEQSQELLGADLLLTSRAEFGSATRARVAELETQALEPASQITRFGSMALALRSGNTRLVDVQGLAGGFPFYGEVRTDPPQQWSRLASDEPIALVDPGLLLQLDMQLGDSLSLGGSFFRIVGTVTRSPGTFGMRTQLAPRVFIPRRFVEATGLVQRGSLVEHRLYLSIPQTALGPWLAANRKGLDAERVRFQTVEGYQENLGRGFGSLTQYLSLIGLAALALGGIGVASGVRVFVREKLDTVAVLRSLGARPRDVVATYGLLALGLGAVAGVVGSAAGVAFQALLPFALADFLPVEVRVRVDPLTIATGLGTGLWVTVLFAAAPLLDLAGVAPLRALRRDFSQAASRSETRRGRIGMVGALAVSLLIASLAQAPSWRAGVAFAAGLGAALALLAGAAAALASWLRSHRLRGAPFWLRQGVANLFRPRNHTLATTLAIGFGLFLVSTLHSVQHNVMRELVRDARPDRPNLVFLDVQRDQEAGLDALLEEYGAPVLERAPIISARVEQVGESAAELRLGDDDLDSDQRWALGREYRVTYASELRESESVFEGAWWDDAGAGEPPFPVSLERDIAAALRARVGDTIRWSVQGVPVESVVRSLREVDWGRMGTNFFAIFPPGVLEEAPQSSVVLARLEDERARSELQRDLVTRFPNVSALDATAILRALDTVLGKTAFAVRVVAVFTLATGFMILLAAASAARHERTREALLLRTLGASTRTVRRVIVAEAATLGGLAAVVGSGLALAAAWALVHFVFELRFAPPWLDIAGLAAATVVVTAAVGALHAGPAASATPLAGLRETELGGQRA